MDDGTEPFRRALALITARLGADDDAKDVLLEGLTGDARDLALALADVAASVLESVTDEPAAWTQEALRRVIAEDMHNPPALD